MKAGFTQAILITILAVIFTIGLTFASVELPRLLSTFLDRAVPHPDVDSHADELSVYRTELYIRHYHIRLIGYSSLALIVILIAAGFITKRSGLASAGAILFFLPVFGQFAVVMFFLAGLGILNLIWMPILDTSFRFLRLGDIAYIPYRILTYISSLFSFDIHTPLVYALIGAGLLIFALGTLVWLYARFQKRDIADFWIYRLSRHPQYLGWIIWSYGLLILLLRIPYPKRSWGIPSSLPWLISSMVIMGVAMLEELKMQYEWGQEYELYRRRVSFMLPAPRFVSRIVSAPMRLIIRKEYPERKREVAATIALYTAVLLILSAIFGSFTTLSEIKGLVSTEYKEKDIDRLVRVFKETKDRRARHYAAESLSKVGEPAVDEFVELLKDGDPAIREYSAEALGKIKSDRAVQPLIAALSDNNQNVCCKAAWALGEMQSQEAIQPLIESLQNQDSVIRYNVAIALGNLGSEQGVDALIPGLKDVKWYIRIAHVRALGELKSERAVESLIGTLRDEDRKVRCESALALLRIRSEKAIEPLTEALKDEDWEVRFYATEALNAIREGDFQHSH